MSRLDWCKKQSKGIKLIDPSDNLSKEYFASAEETLKVLHSMKNTGSRMWLATTKYYFKYLAIYSVFMKLGIKCEIHECSIDLVSFLEQNGIFRDGTYNNLFKDKDLRIDNQYYLKNKPVIIDFEELSDFLINIHSIIDSLDKKKIDELRKLIFSL